MNYQQLQHSWAEFSQRITAFVNQLGLDGLSLQADHAALRVNSNSAAQLLADEFSQHGEVISNNMINGRPILIIKLTKPLVIGTLQIPCVELPFPSDKVYPLEGWEHIELVFPSQTQTCEALVAELIEQAPQLASIIDNAQAGIGEISVKQSSPKGDNERLANPTIAFKTKGICVKVHPHDIQTIIASEQ